MQIWIILIVLYKKTTKHIFQRYQKAKYSSDHMIFRFLLLYATTRK
jgi:hypothetical protein